jgi:hypothetical protein
MAGNQGELPRLSREVNARAVNARELGEGRRNRCRQLTIHQRGCDHPHNQHDDTRSGDVGHFESRFLAAVRLRLSNEECSLG